MLLIAASVTISVAIGVVCLIAGAITVFRGRVLFGLVLVVIGLLLGGLTILGVFD
jgi:hypothetical protein